MFPPEIYIQRRKRLRELVGKGVVLFLGNKEVAMNYAANNYPFRQDSSFLYYFGLDMPGLAGMIDCENDAEILYGSDPTLEDIIWVGKQEPLQEKALRTGITKVKPLERLDGDVFRVIAHSREVHYLPPYREQRRLQLAYYDNLRYEEVDRNASRTLIKAVVTQRSVKDQFELTELEETMNNVTSKAYSLAAGLIKPGTYEFQVAGAFEGYALKNNCRMAYPVICTINGETLHNHFYGNEMKDGQLLLVDAGVESVRRYATDITRTYPVNGKFSTQQKEIYQIVLEAQEEAIKAIKPGIPYLEVHQQAATLITKGLKELGLMKGSIDEAVNHGAHALFFPHGIGHMIGLDVHDMEDIGEEHVGYDDEFKRSEQFGTAYLRMAKRLETGNVVTVEPGIYFIDPLINKWHSEGRYRDFIDYRALEKFRGTGGIRIEDNVTVTENGSKVIGNHIPKTIGEVEALLKNKKENGK
ncbi:MAG TPA: aminopeptidase P family protein [Bacteroidales bacterium]|nr:aminopeptidase P family protein [Bacteroidales bacterium]